MYDVGPGVLLLAMNKCTQFAMTFKCEMNVQWADFLTCAVKNSTVMPPPSALDGGGTCPNKIIAAWFAALD